MNNVMKAGIMNATVTVTVNVSGNVNNRNGGSVNGSVNNGNGGNVSGNVNNGNGESVTGSERVKKMNATNGKCGGVIMKANENGIGGKRANGSVMTANYVRLRRS
jgi:hypothetical protein